MKIRRKNLSVSLENKWFDLHCVHIWLFCVTNPLMLSCCKNLAWTQYTNDFNTLTDWGCCSKSFWGRYGQRSQVKLGFGSRILHLIKVGGTCSLAAWLNAFAFWRGKESSYVLFVCFDWFFVMKVGSNIDWLAIKKKKWKSYKEVQNK